jgi:hypothetical protein
MGLQALEQNTTASNNVGIGVQALQNNTTGTRNVAVGANALDANTTANNCTAVGWQAATTADGATDTTAIGAYALQSLTTGDFNTAVGQAALVTSTTGASNTAVGVGAGRDVTTASNCTLIGVDAGADITTGGGNTCIGEDAGDKITTGYANICIGENSDVDTAGRIRATIIGQDAGTIAQNNTFRAIGDNGVFNSANTSSWSTTSDERIKKNIVDHTKGLNIINQVKVRNFEYRTAEEITDSSLAGRNVADIAVNKTGIQTGLIAQEIELVRPEVIITDDWGIKRVNRDELFWDMMKAIQELSAEVNALKAA